MPDQLVLSAINYFSGIQFPSHTITAEEEASGFDVENIANGRREAADRWQPTTSNSDSWVKTRCDVPRQASFLAIDRESNHKGYRYRLEGSNDDFATDTDILDVNTIPTAPGGTLAGATGAVTSEGAWLKTFTAEVFNDWRLYSVAMGASLVPQLTGVHLGPAFQPGQFVVRFPLEDNAVEVLADTAVSPYGWRGYGPRAVNRRGTLRLGFADEADEAAFAEHLDWFLRGFPLWLCWQATSRPWRALLVESPGGEVRDVLDAAWHHVYRAIDVPFVESQPVLV